MAATQPRLAQIINLVSSLAAKAPLASPTFTGTVSGVSKSMVGLGNADNTSDANKPVSTATQTALDLKAPIASPTFTGTVSGVSKSMVGLGNADNTSDANKPVSTAQQTALDLKADLASPNFSGTPQISGVSIATQSFVTSAVAGVGKRSRVRVATTANVDLSTDLANGQTLDGETLATGNLVLVKDQTDPAENGVYTVPASGAASRTPEFDTFNELPGSLVAVQEGTAGADTIWLCTTDDGGTLETDDIVFSKLEVSGEPDATESIKGVVELATTGEATTGSDTTRAITAAGLKAHVDARKIDDLAAPDDNTDLNATTSAHGLLPKLGGGTTNFLRADGTWADPVASGLSSGDVVVRETPTGTINGTNDAFVIAFSPLSGSDQVFVNGILQEGGGEDYTISGTTITFEAASIPQTDDRLRVTYFKA